MKRIFLIFSILILVIASVLFTSCFSSGGNQSGKKPSNPTDTDDTSDTTLSKNFWYAESVLLPYEPNMNSIFGDKGETGILSDSAYENNGNNVPIRDWVYLVCAIYGDVPSTFALETELELTLVNGTQILYGDECASFGTPTVYSTEDTRYIKHYTAELSMNEPKDRRLIISGTPTNSEIKAFAVIPVLFKDSGTLYANFKIDCPSLPDNNRKVKSENIWEIGDKGTADLSVNIENLNTQYITETDYISGGVVEDKLMSSPDFTDGQTNYMVLSFDFSPDRQNSGDRYVNIVVRVPEASVMNTTIEEAPTGNIKQTVKNDVYTVYASFMVLPEESAKKSVSLIIKLNPLDDGIANVDIFVTSDQNTEIVGDDHATVSLVSGVPTVRYTLSSNGEYYIASSLWKSKTEEVVIPDTYKGLPVAEISQNFFTNNALIKHITIGNNITSLSKSAFSGCTSLESLVIGDGVKSLNQQMFKGCSSLKTVTVGTGLNTLSDNLFSNLSNLTTVTLKGTITEIPRYCFAGCINLTSITGIENATTIRQYAFSGCRSLQTINTESITSFEEGAFINCKLLKSFDFSKYQQIPSKAFSGCTSLTAVSSSLVKKIGSESFSGCTSLTSVDCPNLNYISSSAFSGCSSLSSITVDNLLSIGGSAFKGCTKLDSLSCPKLTALSESCFEGSSIKSFSAPLARSIPASAFKDSGLSNLNTPEIESIGKNAFLNCSSLNVSLSFTKLTSVGDEAFKGCSSLPSVSCSTLSSVGSYAFMDCTSLATFVSAPLSEITVGVFKNCHSLKSINLTGVQEISYDAFLNCRSLTEIIFPDTCTSVFDDAFKGATSLRTVHFGAKTRLSSSGGIYGNNIDKTSLTTITVSENHQSYVVEGNCLIDKTESTLVLAANNAVIPDYVKEIGPGAFSGIKSLSSITIPQLVKVIAENAFEGCTALKNVTILSSSFTICARAFKDCSALSSVDFNQRAFKLSSSRYGSSEMISISSATEAANLLKSTYVDKYISTYY